jgi:hypothetical protein
MWIETLGSSFFLLLREAWKKDQRAEGRVK